LPFVPVTAIIFALVYLDANSISEIIGTLNSLIFLIILIEEEIPGLLIIKSDLIIFCSE
jgi:hypothetical protein